jgi:MFS family permease
MQMTLQSPATTRTNIPFRLDRLPWSRFHLLVVIGLGITWILDGLEVTIVGSLGPALQYADTLHLSSANLGAVASSYVVGAVIGALVFGWITDRHGRRLVFYVTLIVYLSGVLLSAFAWNFWSFAIFRMITGLGIGGEYAAVNSRSMNSFRRNIVVVSTCYTRQGLCLGHLREHALHQGGIAIDAAWPQ